MYIGSVAKQTGATPKAIRLYEQLGLIPSVDRKGKYRYFSESHVALIHIIKEIQRKGFKLAEIKEFLNEGVSCSNFPWAKAITMVQNKIQSNNDKIAALRNHGNELIKFIDLLKSQRCAY